MPLDPEIKKFIEEIAKENKYDSNKDPVMIEFRRKMKALKYEPPSYDNSWVNLLALIILLTVLFLASR